jgi:hypothetical protein
VFELRGTPAGFGMCLNFGGGRLFPNSVLSSSGRLSLALPELCDSLDIKGIQTSIMVFLPLSLLLTPKHSQLLGELSRCLPTRHPNQPSFRVSAKMNSQLDRVESGISSVPANVLHSPTQSNRDIANSCSSLLLRIHCPSQSHPISYVTVPPSKELLSTSSSVIHEWLIMVSTSCSASRLRSFIILSRPESWSVLWPSSLSPARWRPPPPHVPFSPLAWYASC